jgi:hypothetical protein
MDRRDVSAENKREIWISGYDDFLLRSAECDSSKPSIFVLRIVELCQSERDFEVVVGILDDLLLSSHHSMECILDFYGCREIPLWFIGAMIGVRKKFSKYNRRYSISWLAKNRLPREAEKELMELLGLKSVAGHLFSKDWPSHRSRL